MEQSNPASQRLAGAAALIAVAALGSSCTSTIGPYIRNIEVRPDGAVVVERCTSLVTDYALGGTIDNDAAYCDQNVLPIQGVATPKPAETTQTPQGPAFPAGPAPTAPPSPPPMTTAAPPPATTAQVVTPPGIGPGMNPPQPAPGSITSCPPGMALMPAGSFSMGDRKDRVKVSKFCMDITEVTVDAYTSCIRNGQCSADGLACGNGATYGALGKGDHPINCVDWNQAGTYCNSVGKRLPTEEEWEWAARSAALGKMFPWGNIEPTSQACWSGNGQLTGTCQAGSYVAGASAQGILDLAGNVWEWTTGRKDASSSERVARGGAWSSTASTYLRSAERYWTQPAYRFIYIGFRCVK